MEAQKTWRQIGLFLALTVLFSSLFYAFIIVTGRTGGGNGAYAAGLMWSPGLAALITCRLTGVSLASLGWRWGAWRWQWLAWFTPLAYSVVAYGFVWLTRLGFFGGPEQVASIRHSLGWTSAPDAVVVAGWFLLLGTTGMVGSAARALGEEIGWRGFLAPRMNQLLGFRGGAILTGLIWTCWHLPLLLFADYNNGTPWWYGMGCFTVMVVSISVVMSWLRLKSGSLWTGVLLHASHNLYIQALLTPATTAHGSVTAYAIGEFGFAVPVVALAIAIGVLVKAGKGPQLDAAAAAA
jgi:membrane protease YdiL (CAAX protease family)